MLYTQNHQQVVVCSLQRNDDKHLVQIIDRKIKNLLMKNKKVKIVITGNNSKTTNLVKRELYLKSYNIHYKTVVSNSYNQYQNSCTLVQLYD